MMNAADMMRFCVRASDAREPSLETDMIWWDEREWKDLPGDDPDVHHALRLAGLILVLLAGVVIGVIIT